MARDQRRLAAIVSADVAGYSRLMGNDESGTLVALKAHRRELIDPKIAEYGGRIVKTTGDGLLLEFPSVVDALRCAVDVQRAMGERNAAEPQDRRIEFRIGINVGDIIIDGDDIFGDGVNIAARLETLCEPGGLCISRAANDQIRDKLSMAFADLGEQAVKNIARAVGVFGLTAKALRRFRTPRSRRRRKTRWRRLGPTCAGEEAKAAHRLGDVLDRLLAEILELVRQLVADMVAHAAWNADAAGLGQPFEACRDVDAVAEDVAVLHHDVADIDADAKAQPARFVERLVGNGELLLDVDRALDGGEDAGEFGQHAVAGRSDDTAAVLGDQLVRDGPMRR